MAQTDLSFGRWLKQQRLDRYLTQDEMAELLDCSPSAVRKFETGERRPSKALADQIAQRLKLSPEEQVVFVRVVRGRDLPAEAPEPRTEEQVVPQPAARRAGISRPRPGNLPVPLTSFVGRAREVGEVRAMLLRPDVRLLTLLGPPGIGKTRLSIAVANSLLDDFQDGVCWVPLATLHSPGLVATTIAAQLGIKESSGPPAEALKTYLADRQLLMVLDNFEQVVEAATLVAELLAAAPATKVLVSSRAALRIYGEHIYAVPLLAVPDPQNLPPLEELGDYAALRLFVERAQAVKPGFSLTARDAPIVAAVTQRLEGLPLAIELAAARMRLLPPRSILARLEKRLDLLQGGAVDLPARQQTLRGAIDWSYDLLSADEQFVFRQLGVFVGGCGVEAAEAVVGGRGQGGGGRDELRAKSYELGATSYEQPTTDNRQAATRRPALDVLGGIESLVSKSLLRAEEAADGEPRFTMFETIREYALEQLAAHDELEAARCRHAGYFLELAEQAEPELTGPDQQSWLVRLDCEHDNIRAALEWAAADRVSGARIHGESGSATGDGAARADIGLRIAGALWRFWEVHGQVSEGRSRLQAALAHAGGAAPEAVAKALNGAGNLAFDEDDYAEAIRLHTASLELNRRLGSQVGVSKSLSNLGNVAHRQGNYSLAQQYHQESLALRRELKDWRGIAISLTNLGEAAAEQGDYAAAGKFYEEALSLAREMGEQWGTALSLNNLGEVALHQGDYAQAERMLQESLEIFRQLGDKRGAALALGNLALLARKQADYERGEPIYQECLLLFRDLGSKHGIAVSLEGLAAVAGGRKQPERAGRLRGAAEAVRATIGAPRPPDNRPVHERRSLANRVEVDRETFAQWWAEGRAMTLEQAVDYALQTDQALSR